MLIFLIPIIVGFSAIAFAGVGNRLKTGRHGTKFERWCSKYDTVLGFTTFMSFAALIIAILFLIGYHIDYAPFPAEYESVKTTIQSSRTDANNVERAAVIHKVIDINRELATVKYWNDSLWVGWFWPDRVAELEYIK